MVDNTDYDKIGKLTPNETIEVLKVYEKYACDSSQMRGANAFIMAIQAIEKVEYLKIELANLLKCYLGDESARMKPMGFDEYIQEIIDELN